MRLLCAAALIISVGCSSAAEDQKDRGEKLKTIKKKFDDDFAELRGKFEKATTAAERQAVKTEAKELATLAAEKLVKLAAENPKDATSFEAIEFTLGTLLRFGIKDADVDQAVAIVAEHHINNPKIKTIVFAAAQSGPAGQKLLKAAAEKSTDPEVKGTALYVLGSALAEEADDADDEKKAAELSAQAIKNLEEAAKIAPDVRLGRETIGEMAKNDINALKTLGVGKPVPDVEGVGLDGKKVKLSSFKGKVVLLDIWATWCPPCRAMIPHEREMVKKMKDKPFVLLSVSADEEKDTLTKFLKDTEMPWTHWWDGGDRKVVNTFKVKAFPTLYLIDATGVVRKKWVGSPPPEVLDKAVEELVKSAEKK